MPSRMRASLSIQSTWSPASEAADAGRRLGLDLAPWRLHQPPPAAARKSACPCRDLKRCGFLDAAPGRCGRRWRGRGRGLRASRAPSSSRVNSRKTVFSLSPAMPMPVSITWISASSPRRRTPTRMRPLARVFDGVGDQVLDQAAQQIAVGLDVERRRHDRRVRASSRRPSAGSRCRSGAAVRPGRKRCRPASSRRRRAGKCRAPRRGWSRPIPARIRC